MELCGVATVGGDDAMEQTEQCDTRPPLSSALLSLLWLKKCSCSGWCREEGKGEHSTVHSAWLHSRSISASLHNPLPQSFFLPPLSSHARCIFGSEWQFCTASHCSTATEWWQVPPSTPPNPFLFHKLNLRRGMQRNKEICSHADVYINDGWGPTATQQSFIGKYHILLHDYVIIHQRV